MTGAKIQPAVIGATGYAGFELTRLLLSHPRVKTPMLLSREQRTDASLAAMYPQIASEDRGDLPFEPISLESMQAKGVDVVFCATPHEFSREWIPEAIDRGLRVVDLSGAWRLKNHDNRAVYKFGDGDGRAAKLDGSAVYGIPELHGRSIGTAQLVANAGCYATSVILALTPWVRAGLIDVEHGIICDSKSGVSGAGKQPTPTTHFVEVANNLSAYSVFGHRHTGEIVEQLGVSASSLQFTPHLLPIPRGILSTIYVRVNQGVTAEDLQTSLKSFYSGQPFVRVLGNGRLPQIKFSLYTNYCDVGFSLSPDGCRAVLVSCLDNLVKGAAGQALQNMNVMFGYDQREGLQ